MSKVPPTVLAIAVVEVTPGIRYCNDSVDKLLARLEKEVGIKVNKAELLEAAPEVAEILADVGYVMTLKADGSIRFRACDLDPNGKLIVQDATAATTQQAAKAPAQPSVAQMREREAHLSRLQELAARHGLDAVRLAIRERLQAVSSVDRR